MKKLYTLLLALPLLFGACSSGDDAVVTPIDPETPEIPEKPDPEPKDEIRIEGTLPTFSYEASQASIKLTATSAWKATVSEKWCTLSAMEGSEGEKIIEVKVERNKHYDERSAKIVFTAVKGSAKAELQVVQKQHDALLASPAHPKIGYKGGKLEITLQSNINYTIDIDKESAAWITVVETRSLKSETLVLSIGENKALTPRTGKVVFRSSTLNETLEIEQEGAPSNPEPTGDQRIKIIHTSATMPVPALLNPAGFEASVLWETSSTVWERYSPELVHYYPEEGPYTITIKGSDIEVITVKRINKVQVIDLSEF